MRLTLSSTLPALGAYIPRFLDLVGREYWFKRVDHLDTVQNQSPFQFKIVNDYHWLEMTISFQSDVLATEGRLRPELTDVLNHAALTFIATTVEVHAHLSPIGQRNLVGRLRDGLQAETGYASLYLELTLAQRLMDEGFDVDIDSTAKFDLLFRRGVFTGEVECKSLSADAGRQIHRKDFYRFMDALSPALEAHRTLCQPEVLLITLEGRLSSRLSDQAALRTATRTVLEDRAQYTFAGHGFELERRDFNAVQFGESLSDARAFYSACSAAFGPNPHVAGGLTEVAGCLVVMRSKRADDTSKPMLEAMRKASGQFSWQRPAFIAIQMHGIEPADLMLPHIRRRAGILSYALYCHYGGSHVNATYFTGFGAVCASHGTVGTPAFAIPNPKPAFSVEPAAASPFLAGISEGAYAAAIGAPLPASNISVLPIHLSRDETNG